MKTLLLLLFSTTLFTACKKDKGEDQLPPATQTGANTFGCLINGEIYTPQGFEQNHPNFDMVVDPTFENGNFGFSTFNKNKKLRLNLGTNSIKNTGILYIQDTSKPLHIGVYNDNSNCYFSPGTINYYDYYSVGNLTITRYDLTNGIFSGTFEFILYDPATSCDTIKVTQGRFDKKLN